MNKTLPLLVLLSPAVMVGAIDVSGNWQGTLKSGDQSVPWYVTVEQRGDTCSGTMGPENPDDRRPVQDCKIDGSNLHFRVPGGDGSGTEFVTVDLRLQDGDLTGTLQGKDRTGQPQTYTLSLKPATAHDVHPGGRVARHPRMFRTV